MVPVKKVSVTLWLDEAEADRWRRSLEPARVAIVREGKTPPAFEDFLVMLCREGFRAVIRQSSAPQEPERKLILTPEEAARV